MAKQLVSYVTKYGLSNANTKIQQKIYNEKKGEARLTFTKADKWLQKLGISFKYTCSIDKIN